MTDETDRVEGRAMLGPRDDDLWVVDAPLSVAGIALGTRMTVIRLADGSLFLHSPSQLSSKLCAELEALGSVEHIVAPNKIHHLFVSDYATAFPDAKRYAAPGLEKKRPQLDFHFVLEPAVPEPWSGQIDQVCFQGANTVNEVVFFHRASRTLLLTDLAFNFQHTNSLWTKFWLKVDGAYRTFGPSRMVRVLIRDREAARRSMDEVLSWDFDRVIVTHGIVLQQSGKRMVRSAFDWL
jgi:hypothetical protein